MDFRSYVKNHIVMMDGALGTYFDVKHHELGKIVEEVNLENPDQIKEIHKEYLESGANLLRSNTFALNRYLCLQKGMMDKKQQDAYLKKGIAAACDIAKTAIKETGKQAWICADIGPINEQLFIQYPSYDKKEEYRFLIDAFLDCGVNIFDFETFGEIEMIAFASEYILKRCPTAYIMASFSINRSGYSNSGYSIKHLFLEASKIKSLHCYGCNCSIGVSHMYQLLHKQSFSKTQEIMALPNSGYPQILRGRTIYSDGVSYFAKNLAQMAELGINFLGGCCGTTPEHIKEAALLLKDKKPMKKHSVSEEETAIFVPKSQNNPFLRKLENKERVIAVELDPPFDQNEEKLMEGAYQLKNKDIDVITIADSPLGRSRADSVLLASRLHQIVDIPVMPHIACRDRNRISMHSTILGAHMNQIRNLLIVTGDPVPSGERDKTKAVFDFNSITFMKYLQQLNKELLIQDPIAYGGALNQNRANVEKLIERMQKKIDAGVSYFLTQPIYSKLDVEKIALMKKRLDTKILCGIMPLVSYRNAMFIKNEMPGIHVPDEVSNAYHPEMSREEAEEVAKKISISIIKQLDGIADGFYFMTPFNRVSLICDIIDLMEQS